MIFPGSFFLPALFIHLDLTGKGLIIRIRDNDRMMENLIQSINGFVRQTQLVMRFSDGIIKLKQRDGIQKFCEGYL